MRKDNKEFRLRFLRWKNGELVYENGRALPAYEEGTAPYINRLVDLVVDSTGMYNTARYNANEDLYEANKRYSVTVTGKKPNTYKWVSPKTIKQADFGDIANMANIAGFGILPGASDVEDLANVGNDIVSGNYGAALAGLGMFAIPNVIEKPAKKLAIPIIRKIAKTDVAKRAAETAMRTSGNAIPLDEIRSGWKNSDYHRKFAILKYVFTGKRTGDFGYYNSLASNPNHAYTGFVHKSTLHDPDLKSLDDANIHLMTTGSRYGDAIDAYLYGKEINPTYGLNLLNIGSDFGLHTDYINKNYKHKSSNIPVYSAPHQDDLVDMSIPYEYSYMINPSYNIGTNGYIDTSNHLDIAYDAAGHRKEFGYMDKSRFSREQDIWKYNPSDYDSYIKANKVSGFKKMLTSGALHFIDAAGTPIIVRTPWLLDTFGKDFNDLVDIENKGLINFK